MSLTVTVMESVETSVEGLVEIVRPDHLGAVPVLSVREIEVLLAWFSSESKDGAAVLLFISPATVATHIARVRAKYAGAGRAARSKTALFARLLEDGYTSLGDW